MTRNPGRARPAPQARTVAWVRSLLACCAALAVAGEAPAQGDGEVALQAAVIYNLVQFVQWPESAAARDVQFCVVEGDALAAGLSALDGQAFGSRRLRVRGVAASRTTGCDALYLPEAAFAAGRPPREAPILVLTSGHGLVDQGAMVNVMLEGRRVAFDVGLGALRRAGFSVSAKVLRLARYVRQD